jgi:hypothetical protein
MTQRRILPPPPGASHRSAPRPGYQSRQGSIQAKAGLAPPPIYWPHRPAPQTPVQAQRPIHATGRLPVAASAALAAGPRPGVVQRWIKLGPGTAQENNQEPKGHVPLQDYWEWFRQDLWSSDLAYRERVVKYYNPGLQPIPSNQQITIQGDIHQVNDLADRVGCSNCVAADFLNLKLSKFQGWLTSRNLNYPLQGRNGVGTDAFFKAIGISSTFEVFNGPMALLKALESDDDTFEVAVAWDGHVIRGWTMAGSGIKLWDPQGWLKNFLLPANKNLFMWTLNKP